MKPHHDPDYTKQYLRGYAFGMHPAFKDCEDCSKMMVPKYTEAFIAGFEVGRSGYELMNGKLSDGLPKKIVNDTVLRLFYERGQLGEPFIHEGYTLLQQKYTYESYQRGYSEYDPDFETSLSDLLKIVGIDLN